MMSELLDKAVPIAIVLPSAIVILVFFGIWRLITIIKSKLKNQIESLNQIIKEKEDLIKEKDALIAKLQTQELELKNQIESLNQIIKEKEDLIKEKDALIAKQTRELGLKNHIGSLSQIVKEKEDLIKEKDSLIAKLQTQELELKNQIESLSQIVKEKEDLIKEKDFLIAKLQTQELELKNQIESLSQIIKKKEEKEKILNSIFKSEIVGSEDKLDEIERTLRELIKEIDYLNIYPNEYEKFEEIINEFEKFKVLHIKPVRAPTLSFAFVGEFSVGKSSIINSLLGEKILEVDLMPTTAVPTFLVYGYGIDEVLFIDFKNRIRKISYYDFKNVKEESLRGVPLNELIKYFVVYLNNEKLKRFTIMDTPGISSKEEDFNTTKRRLYEWISEIKNIFFVIDIEEGTIKRNVLDILKGLHDDRNVFIIINKCDTKPPSERKKVIEHVQDTCNKVGINVCEIIPYSTKKGKEGYDPQKIWDVVEKYGGTQEETFLKYIKNLQEELREKIKREYLKSKSEDMEKAWLKIDEYCEKLKSMIKQI